MFDAWMRLTYPHIPFEQSADDAIGHHRSGTEPCIKIHNTNGPKH